MDYEGRFTPNVGAGAYLKGTRYFLSLSVPKFLSPERLKERNGNAFIGDDRLHAYLSGGYDFILSKTLDLKTVAMIRYQDSSPVSLELTGILNFLGRGSSWALPIVMMRALAACSCSISVMALRLDTPMRQPHRTK